MIGFLSHLSPSGTVGIEVELGGSCHGCERPFREGDHWVAIAEMGKRPDGSQHTLRTFEIHGQCFQKLKAKLEAADEQANP